jgi:hypothetical protein
MDCRICRAPGICICEPAPLSPPPAALASDDGTCVRCGAAPRNASGLCATCLAEDAERAGEIPPAAQDLHELEPALDRAADALIARGKVIDQLRQERDELQARVARLETALQRAQTILANMAQENKGAVFNRWPINHEPLRADAQSLLPIIDAALSAPAAKGGENEAR